MMDISDKLIFLGGSLSGIIAASLYALYKNKHETASQIKNAEMVQLDTNLEKKLMSTDNHCIGYASVEGIVTDLGKTFSTKNSLKKGVVLQTSRTEHKSQRIHGFWADAKNVLRDTFDIAPFAIQDPDNPGQSIMVIEPTEADELLESLEVTHDQFIPHKTTAVQTGIDRLFGEVCHGVQETEEMLVVGTGLVGIGEIFLEGGHLKLGPPQATHTKYILTRMSKSQLIKQIQAQAASLKAFAIVFGMVTVSLVGFLIWRLTKKYLAYRKSQRDFEEIRCSALRRYAEVRDERVKMGDEPCVVCLGNPREVVTLDCGHIAMCCDCAEMLPSPHKCPVCRDEIKRFLPVYRP